MDLNPASEISGIAMKMCNEESVSWYIDTHTYTHAGIYLYLRFKAVKRCKSKEIKHYNLGFSGIFWFYLLILGYLRFPVISGCYFVRMGNSWI